MKIEAVITQVKSRSSVNMRGQPVTYFDAYALDGESDPMKRYPGQIMFKPTADEIKERSICEGARFTLNIMAIEEVRNGVPICQVKLETPAKRAP